MERSLLLPWDCTIYIGSGYYNDKIILVFVRKTFCLSFVFILLGRHMSLLGKQSYY